MESVGEENELTMTTTISLGNVYFCWGKYEDALMRYKKALDFFRNEKGHESTVYYLCWKTALCSSKLGLARQQERRRRREKVQNGVNLKVLIVKDILGGLKDLSDVQKTMKRCLLLRQALLSNSKKMKEIEKLFETAGTDCPLQTEERGSLRKTKCQNAFRGSNSGHLGLR
eukprot:m.222152 g.222152  ORF g.222152 m.222152 type:complete len:171 (+) comp39971_c0_seq46:939-1451(+)